MTDGKVDLHDVLAALEPHGWRRAHSFQGLYRAVESGGLMVGWSTIRVTDLADRFIFTESWAGKPPLLGKSADRKEGTAVEVLAHVVARCAKEAA